MTIECFKDFMTVGTATSLSVLLISLSAAGCASSGSQPQVQRSDEDAALRMLECPDQKKPTCIRRMGTMRECSCNTNADFRKVWGVNL